MRAGWTLPASAAAISACTRWLVPIGLAHCGAACSPRPPSITGRSCAFVGSRGLAPAADAWKDPVFSRPLPFYLFDLPFYSQLLGFVFALAILCALLFWATARGWQLWLRGGLQHDVDAGPRALLLPGASRSGFVRVIALILLLGLAAWVYLGNYDLLLNSHAFMTGADYVDAKITLPLRWLLIVSILAAIPLVWTSRYKKALILVVGVFVLQLGLPVIVGAVYVRPNEISIERPYIERHIEATTAAFGLNRNATERPFNASGQTDGRRRAGRHAARQRSPVGPARLQRHDHPDPGAAPVLHVSRHRCGPLLPRRPHQAGAAVAARNRRQPVVRRGQPELDQSALYLHARLRRGHVRGQQDHARRTARPADRKRSAGNQIARISAHAPGDLLRREHAGSGVCAHRARRIRLSFRRPEQVFDLPGHRRLSRRHLSSESCRRHLPGRAQHHFHQLPHRPEPHDDLSQRAANDSQHLAGFLHWDPDPYLVVTDDGRLVWMVDGYTTSLSHPYSATLPVTGLEGRRQLHSQRGKGHRGRLHRKNLALRLRSEPIR